ncbi:unnamed protein product, partial [marine sediment metagenome]
MGIDARMAERGQAMEGIGGIGSLGLIDISEGPIRWINVRKETDYDGDFEEIDYYTDYGVPDPKLETTRDLYGINTVPVKSFPLFGRIV